MRSDKAPILNEYDSTVRGAKLYRFDFGAVGTTRVYVWDGYNAGLDGALDDAAEWLRENAPGLFTEPDYMGAAEELDDEYDTNLFTRAWLHRNHERDDFAVDRVIERAETDLTYTESGWIPSWEWGAAEIPAGSEEWNEVKARTDRMLPDEEG